MKKNIKILIMSCAGLLILGATLLVLYLTREVDQPPEPPPPPDNTTVALTEMSADDILFIHINNHNETSGYSIAQNPEEPGDFIIPDFILRHPSSPVPYNLQEIARVAGIAAAITAQDTIEENAENLSQYGLTSPRGQVDVVFNDGTSFGFFIGNATPLGSSVYIKPFHSDTVYIVHENITTPFLRERHQWVLRQAFPYYDSNETPRIDRVTIHRIDLGEPMVIEAMPIPPLEEVRTFNTHRLISPLNVEIDQEKGMRVLFGIFGLIASEVVLIAPDEAELEYYGFNNPASVISIEFGDEVYTLTIGTYRQTADGVNLGWYGMSSHVPEVLFLFTPESMPWIYVQQQDIIAEMFLTPYIHSLERVEITAGDISLNVTVADEVEDFRDLYMFLISAKGEELFLEDLPHDSQLIARITYVYKDRDSGSETVEFYTAEGESLRSIIRLNGENVFKTRIMYTTRLLENIQAYIDGGSINYDW